MQYMILIYGDEARWASLSPAEAEAGMGAWFAYTEAMKHAGVFVAGDPLESITKATAVRTRNGKTEVLDGPFAETKEQLGGYYLIDVPDADAAIAWATRCPGAAYGTIEVRPIMAIPAAAP